MSEILLPMFFLVVVVAIVYVFGSAAPVIHKIRGYQIFGYPLRSWMPTGLALLAVLAHAILSGFWWDLANGQYVKQQKFTNWAEIRKQFDKQFPGAWRFWLGGPTDTPNPELIEAIRAYKKSDNAKERQLAIEALRLPYPLVTLPKSMTVYAGRAEYALRQVRDAAEILEERGNTYLASQWREILLSQSAAEALDARLPRGVNLNVNQVGCDMWLDQCVGYLSANKMITHKINYGDVVGIADFRGDLFEIHYKSQDKQFSTSYQLTKDHRLWSMEADVNSVIFDRVRALQSLQKNDEDPKSDIATTLDPSREVHVEYMGRFAEENGLEMSNCIASLPVAKRSWERGVSPLIPDVQARISEFCSLKLTSAHITGVLHCPERVDDETGIRFFHCPTSLLNDEDVTVKSQVGVTDPDISFRYDHEYDRVIQTILANISTPDQAPIPLSFKGKEKVLREIILSYVQLFGRAEQWDELQNFINTRFGSEDTDALNRRLWGHEYKYTKLAKEGRLYALARQPQLRHFAPYHEVLAGAVYDDLARKLIAMGF